MRGRRTATQLVVGALGTAMVLTACSSDGPTSASGDGQESFTIRLLSGFEAGSVFNGPVDILIPEIEERSGGRIQVEVSGPEVVPFTEQIDAVGNGVYDVLYNVPLFHTGQVPEGEALYFIPNDSSCAEYQESGALDIYDEAHREKAGVMFLACGGGGAHGATFFTTEPFESLEDFEGKRFRGFGFYTRVLDTLGASSVAMPPPEIYNAIDRGVVDGAAFPNLGVVEQGFHEVAPYMMLPPYLPFRYAFYMNPDAYEGMPEDLRDLLVDTLWELETEFDEYWTEKRDAEHEEMLDLGVQVVEMSEEDSATLQQVVVEEAWSYLEENSPEFGPRLHEAFEAVEGR